MVFAEEVLVTVLAGEGLGVVLAEEVLVAVLSCLTYKSVVTAPYSRPNVLPGVLYTGHRGESTIQRLSGKMFFLM